MIRHGQFTLSALDVVSNSWAISHRRTRTWLWSFHYLWLTVHVYPLMDVFMELTSFP